MFLRSNFVNRRFFDDKHFPYGFSRSGDFTLAEVKELESHGVLYKALSEGVVSDPNKDDLHFLEVLAGKVEAKNSSERAWLKYLQRCSQTPVWLTTRRLVEDDEFEDDLSVDDTEDKLEEAV